MKAVLLAGGLGTRLYPLTLILPKPLLMLGDRTVVEHIIEWLKGAGIDDVVIAISRNPRLFETFMGKVEGVRVSFVESHEPLGTAGQLKHAALNIKETFVAVYGDGIIETDLRPMLEFHMNRKPIATIMAMKVQERGKYGLLIHDEDMRLKDWEEKPVQEGWIAVGCFVFEPRFLSYIPKGRFGMDEAVRRALRAGEEVLVYRATGRFLDLGTKEGYYRAVKEFKERMGRLP